MALVMNPVDEMIKGTVEALEVEMLTEGVNRDLWAKSGAVKAGGRVHPDGEWVPRMCSMCDGNVVNVLRVQEEGGTCIDGLCSDIGLCDAHLAESMRVCDFCGRSGDIEGIGEREDGGFVLVCSMCIEFEEVQSELVDVTPVQQIQQVCGGIGYPVETKNEEPESFPDFVEENVECMSIGEMEEGLLMEEVDEYLKEKSGLNIESVTRALRLLEEGGILPKIDNDEVDEYCGEFVDIMTGELERATLERKAFSEETNKWPSNGDGRYRTVMCKRGVGCPIRDICTFAHDASELRCPVRDSRYRTEMCWSGMSCKRINCGYAHDPSELRCMDNGTTSRKYHPRSGGQNRGQSSRGGHKTYFHVPNGDMRGQVVCERTGRSDRMCGGCDGCDRMSSRMRY